jgi:hypothetical protein
MSNQPISEQFRVIAKKWVEADTAANLLEETKSAVLSQMMLKLGEMPVSKAEMQVKGSSEWTTHIEKMVKARSDANLLKVQLEYLRMRHGEHQSLEATQRAEMRM